MRRGSGVTLRWSNDQAVTTESSYLTVRRQQLLYLALPARGPTSTFRKTGRTLPSDSSE